MGSLLSDSLLFPALVIAVLGFLTPYLLAKVLPEGVRPLVLNAFLSTIILFALSAAFFFFLYMWQGAPVEEILAPGFAANVSFFGSLGLSAAIIWGPIMLLSLAALPRKWVNETW